MHERHGYDFAFEMDRCWETGWVFKAPGYFVMAYEDREKDAWLVWWAEFRDFHGLEAIAAAMRLMPHFHTWCGWARPERGRREVRFYSTLRLLRLTGL